MAYQYREENPNLRVSTPCLTLSRELVQTIREEAERMGQTPSRIVQKALLMHYEITRAQKRAWTKSNSVFKPQKESNLQDKRYPTHPRLFELELFEGVGA